MDSQDSSAAPQHHHHQHHHQHHQHHQHQVQHQSLHHLHVQQQQQPPSAMLMAAAQNQLQSQSHHHHHHNSYPLQNHPMNSSNLMRQQQQQQQQQQQHNQSATRYFNSMMAPSAASKIDYSDGAAGSPSPTGGAGGGGGFNIEPSKKKRGRPRKYSPDAAGSSIALGLSPTSVTPISSGGIGLADSAGGGGGALSSETPIKKHRGRPPGSGKRQLDALAGIGFTPHVITVKTGEDIAAKIMAFSEQGPRTVCILSANGAICNVTLRQPGTQAGTVAYEGRFEIISLSGSFLLSENSGSRNRTGGLSVSLAGPDGRVVGGGVAGMLTAATTVQVVVGSFIADGKRAAKYGISSASAQSVGATNMLSFGNPVMDDSPPSQGGSSESSDDRASPMDRSGMPFGNPAQAMQSIPMYGNMGWANSAVKMHPN